MAGSDENIKYRKGDNPELDKKLELYKKSNLFAGNAAVEALSDKEADTLVELWRKARYVPRKLTVHEVSSLVKFSEILFEWRRNKRREQTRLRKEQARRKLREAAKKGNREAVLKLESIKKADVLKSAKYRKMKCELRDKTKKGDVKGTIGGA